MALTGRGLSSNFRLYMFKTYLKNLALLVLLAACLFVIELLQQGATKHANRAFAELPLSKAVYNSHFKANAVPVSNEEMRSFERSSRELAQEHTRIFWVAVFSRLVLVSIFSWLLVLVYRQPDQSFKADPLRGRP
jgi:hypothetical protein